MNFNSNKTFQFAYVYFANLSDMEHAKAYHLSYSATAGQKYSEEKSTSTIHI